MTLHLFAGRTCIRCGTTMTPGTAEGGYAFTADDIAGLSVPSGSVPLSRFIALDERLSAERDAAREQLARVKALTSRPTEVITYGDAVRAYDDIRFAVAAVPDNKGSADPDPFPHTCELLSSLFECRACEADERDAETPDASTPPVVGAPGPHVPPTVTVGGTDATPVPPENPGTGAALIIEVYGTPAPQGSKDQFGAESSKKVKPWREAVKWAALAETTPDYDAAWPIVDPVSIDVTFRFARPKFHFRTGTNAHLLRDNAPTFPSGRPDLDKLLRSTLDALGEAGVFRDDAQVVHIDAMKGYADTLPPGAHITVSAL